MDVPIRQAPLALIEASPSPEQQLAAAVFACALADATDPAASTPDRLSAERFLLEDVEWFAFWSSVADIDADAIRQHARRVLTGGPTTIWNAAAFTAAPSPIAFTLADHGRPQLPSCSF